MKLRIVRDVSALPTFGFDSLSTPWWGTIAFIAQPLGQDAVTFMALPVNPLTEAKTRKVDASSYGKQPQAGGSRDEVRRKERISFDPL